MADTLTSRLAPVPAMSQTTPLLRSGCYHDDWRERQRDLALPTHLASKVIGPKLGVDRKTVDRWRRGENPIPIYQAWRLQRITHNLLFLQSFALESDLVILPRPTHVRWRNPFVTLADIGLAVNKLLEVAALTSDRKPTYQEEQQIDAAVDQIHKDLEEIRANLKRRGPEKEEQEDTQ